MPRVIEHAVSSFNLMGFLADSITPFPPTVAIFRVERQASNSRPVSGLQGQCMEERRERRGSTCIEFEDCLGSADEEHVGRLVQGDAS